jgi:hypothetical protein
VIAPRATLAVAVLIPARTKIGHFGHRLCGNAEGCDDVIIVIFSGRDGETLPETGAKRVRGNMRQKP